MREILFRGKCIDNGEWVIGQYYKRTHYYGDPSVKHYIIVSTEDLGYDQALEYYAVVPTTVGQFTGFVDVTGKDIFEGDIVDASATELALGWPDSTLSVVEWDDKIGGFDPFADYDCDCGIFTKAHKCVVIGNIHDNPELLEEKHD